MLLSPYNRVNLTAMERVNIALLGAGTVGQAFYQLVLEHRDRLAALNLEVGFSGVIVRDTQRPRPPIPASLLSSDTSQLPPDTDSVVEVMGGTGLVGDRVLEALEQDIPVITANKALLAERWEQLWPHADEGLLFYEASVMAGVPVVGALAGTLQGSQVQEIHAVLNGTTNYILGRLEAGVSYSEALGEAQAKGYAEADPSLDVDGFDAAHKLTVLARLAADPAFAWERVKSQTRGIAQLTPHHLEEARRNGQTIYLLASLYGQDGEWQARVRPVRVPLGHPLTQAARHRNALVYRGDGVGELLFSGAGAGGRATASGVLGDLYQLLQGNAGHIPVSTPVKAGQGPLETFEEV